MTAGWKSGFDGKVWAAEVGEFSGIMGERGLQHVVGKHVATDFCEAWLGEDRVRKAQRAWFDQEGCETMCTKPFC